MERRTYVRGHAALPCTLELSTGVAGEFELPLMGQLENVSGGGCMILTIHELPAGGIIRISIHLGDAGEMLLMGRIRHCIPSRQANEQLYVLGVEFIDMDQAAHDRLFWFAVENDLMLQTEYEEL